jgi:hypothetical protein
MAGGEGFEPPLAESESAVLPLDDPPFEVVDRIAGLALTELRCSASFMQADFLAFHFARITSYIARFAQWLAQLAIVFHQGAGQAQANCAGLSGDSAAFDGGLYIPLVGHFYLFQWLTYHHARGFTAKKFVQRTVVDDDLARATGHEYAC